MTERLCFLCGNPEHEQTDDCLGEEDLTDCPYFRRYVGVPGADPDGECSYGCQTEPSCITDQPLGGWPREGSLLPAPSSEEGNE